MFGHISFSLVFLFCPQLEVRCPICKEENVTVSASSLEFTDNGVKARKGACAVADAPGGPGAKSSGTVLKWGGGVAKEKKMKRQMKRKMCMFGDECTRKGCWFGHPRDEGKRAEVGWGRLGKRPKSIN